MVTGIEFGIEKGRKLCMDGELAYFGKTSIDKIDL